MATSVKCRLHGLVRRGCSDSAWQTTPGNRHFLFKNAGPPRASALPLRIAGLRHVPLAVSLQYYSDLLRARRGVLAVISRLPPRMSETARPHPAKADVACSARSKVDRQACASRPLPSGPRRSPRELGPRLRCRPIHPRDRAALAHFRSDGRKHTGNRDWPKRCTAPRMSFGLIALFVKRGHLCLQFLVRKKHRPDAQASGDSEEGV
jgi:hypothetical protein